MSGVWIECCLFAILTYISELSQRVIDRQILLTKIRRNENREKWKKIKWKNRSNVFYLPFVSFMSPANRSVYFVHTYKYALMWIHFGIFSWILKSSSHPLQCANHRWKSKKNTQQNTYIFQLRIQLNTVQKLCNEYKYHKTYNHYRIISVELFTMLLLFGRAFVIVRFLFSANNVLEDY